MEKAKEYQKESGHYLREHPVLPGNFYDLIIFCLAQKRFI
jgi:hypothetical protein